MFSLLSLISPSKNQFQEMKIIQEKYIVFPPQNRVCGQLFPSVLCSCCQHSCPAKNPCRSSLASYWNVSRSGVWHFQNEVGEEDICLPHPTAHPARGDKGSLGPQEWVASVRGALGPRITVWQLCHQHSHLGLHLKQQNSFSVLSNLNLGVCLVQSLALTKTGWK